MKCYDCTLGIINNGNMVLGQGNPNSKIFIVGEAPGYREQRLGIPFVGKSGQYLKTLLFNIGFNKDIYFTNAVRCRPPQNRTPSPIEISKCKHYLYKEIVSINPKHIICLGGTAASLLYSKFSGIHKMLGKRIKLNNMYVYISYHPSFVIRNPEFEQLYIDSLIDIKSQIYKDY